jgi:hypothetical protein
MAQSYLLVIGDVEALAWVLAEQRMAFSNWRRSHAGALEAGDELFVYTTRTCFHRSQGDVGRVMAVATVKTSAQDLREPVDLGGRRFTLGCELTVGGLAPFREGVELRPLVPELHAFPKPHAWTAWLRRTLLPLDGHDAARLQRELAPLLGPLSRNLGAYVEAARQFSKIPSR